MRESEAAAAPIPMHKQGSVREGHLFKKTSKGKWNQRWFMLTHEALTYLKSDSRTEVTMAVSPSVLVRDIKFGVKKFSFEVSDGDAPKADPWVVAASGQREKEHWIEAIEIATGKRAPLRDAEGSRAASARKRQNMQTKITGLQAMLGLLQVFATGRTAQLVQ